MTTADLEAITTGLVEIHTALVEKIGGQPWNEPCLKIHQSGHCAIVLHPREVRETSLHYARGNTPAEAILAAKRFVASMPDPDTRAKRRWHAKLFTMIDEGNALSLPDDVLQPLRQGSQAMTENHLTVDEG